MSRHVLREVAEPLADQVIAQARLQRSARDQLLYQLHVNEVRRSVVRRRPWRRSHPFVVTMPYVPRHAEEMS